MASSTMLDVEGLNEDVAVAPPCTEDDVNDIIAAIARLETGDDDDAAAAGGGGGGGEDGEIVDDGGGGAARRAPAGLGAPLGAARGGAPAKASAKKARRLAGGARAALDNERNTTLLAHAVRAIGAGAARKLLKRVVATQRSGGMDTADGSRKRTAGGVFFFLLRDVMDAAAYKALMSADKKRKDREREARRREREVAKRRRGDAKREDREPGPEAEGGGKRRRGLVGAPLAAPR